MTSTNPNELSDSDIKLAHAIVNAIGASNGIGNAEMLNLIKVVKETAVTQQLKAIRAEVEAEKKTLLEGSQSDRTTFNKNLARKGHNQALTTVTTIIDKYSVADKEGEDK